MAEIFIRPDADSVDGTWVNASGNNTNLYDSIDETSASDADYIRSGNNPTIDIVKLRLSNFGATVAEPMTVRYRFKKVVSGSEIVSMKVRLLQASTTIAEWEHSDVSGTYITEEQELTTDQFNDISDFDDLYLEFEAIGGVIFGGALGLLSGDDDGIAIDATTATPTFAVKDTTTPANDLANVTLDEANTAGTITQLSTSPKLVLWPSSPYLRWSPHNYFLNSGAPATQNVTLVTGFKYTYGITGTGSLAGSSGASGSATAGAPVTFTATGTTGTFTVTGSPTTMWINRGSIQTPYLATTGSVRIGIAHTYDVMTGLYAIWREQTIQNRALNSQDFSTTWAQTDTTRTSTSNSDPEGTSVATLMTEGSAGTASNRQSGIAITSNGTATWQAFLKLGNTNWIRLGIYETAATANRVDAWFNLSTGAKGTPAAGGTGTLFTGGLGSYPDTGGTSRIISIGDGWYQCILCGRVNNSATSVTVDMSSASADGSSTRVNGATYYVFAGQAFNTSSTGFSYIRTVGSAVTRANDDYHIITSKFPFDVDPSSIHFDWVRHDVVSGTGQELYRGSGASGGNTRMDYSNNSGIPCYFTNLPGQDIRSNDTTWYLIGDRSKACASYFTNNTKLQHRSGSNLTDSTTKSSTPTGISYICFMWDDVNGRGYNCYLYKFKHLPRILTNAQMSAWVA